MKQLSIKKKLQSENIKNQIKIVRKLSKSQKKSVLFIFFSIELEV